MCVCLSGTGRVGSAFWAGATGEKLFPPARSEWAPHATTSTGTALNTRVSSCRERARANRGGARCATVNRTGRSAKGKKQIYNGQASWAAAAVAAAVAIFSL